MDNELERKISPFADMLLETVFLVEPKGCIAYVSAASGRMLGFEPQELVGRSMLELIVPEDRDRTVRESSRVISEGQRTGFENRYVHKTGRAVRLAWSARWLESEDLRMGVAREVFRPAREQGRHAGGGQAFPHLAPHEHKVLELLLTDATEKQIAQVLDLAVSTTHGYVTAIFRKFGVRSRAGLMSLWLAELKEEPQARAR